MAGIRWQMQEARQRFGELVRRAKEEGPQMITRRGEEIVVVLSTQEYHRLRGNTPDFKDFLLTGPDLSRLDLRRSKELPWDVKL